MSNATTESKIDEMCDEVFRLEGIVADRDTEIGRLNREVTRLTIAAQDVSKELQVTRDVVAIRDSRIADLEKIRDNCASDVADLNAHVNELVRDIVEKDKELTRKQPVIESQLKRIEELDNQLQNKLADISALEDTISDRDTVRRSVKFNVTHMLQSALAVLNGL
jgi:chromosome segregation ATPase